MDVRVEEREGVVLCALCKTAIGPEPSDTCAGCAVVVHDACAAELGDGTCATPGCGARWSARTSPGKSGQVQAPTQQPAGETAGRSGRNVALVASLALGVLAALVGPPVQEAMFMGEVRARRCTVEDVPQLVELLDRADPDRWVDCRSELTRLGPDAAEAILQQAPRTTALGFSRIPKALKAMGPDVIPVCTRAVESKTNDPATRRVAIRTLGELGHQAQAAAPLIERELERTSDERMRLTCARALGKIGSPTSAPVLDRVSHRTDRAGRVARAALIQLGPAAGDHAVHKPLLELN